MRELVLLSGKGGTGKTSLAASFAHLAAVGEIPVRAVIVDADVDASNLELVLDPVLLEDRAFEGGKVAVIDRDRCTGCMECMEVCRFEALHLSPDSPDLVTVDPVSCEGCAACMHICPENAVHMEQEIAGSLYHSESRYGPLFHAVLHPMQDNSGKLVMAVREMARTHVSNNGFDLILVDGPPGIGCPVISAVTGADLALIVTEPGAAGVHDLKRIVETTGHFSVPILVCINKADIHPEGTAEIKAYCLERNIEVIGMIPFDAAVTIAMIEGVPVTACGNGPAVREIHHLWKRLLR
ncbi:ATP-binding protein [Gemmatimonadota bacterium]